MAYWNSNFCFLFFRGGGSQKEDMVHLPCAALILKLKIGSKLNKMSSSVAVCGEHVWIIIDGMQKLDKNILIITLRIGFEDMISFSRHVLYEQG